MKQFQVRVINIAGGSDTDEYVFTADDDATTAEDVRRHTDAYYTAQNCQPERIEVELLTADA